MRRSRVLLMLCLATLFALPLPAQKTDDQMKALVAAHSGDFDYLLGDWDFAAENQQYGKFNGRWSAARVGDEGPILDEYRIVGDKGETYYVTRTLRVHNASKDRWDLVSTEGSGGLQNMGTGHRRGNEVFIDQKFGVGTKNESSWRIHYYNIGPDHFSWSADRSTDGGKTWVKDFQKIEARRIGPSRTIALTAAVPK